MDWPEGDEAAMRQLADEWYLAGAGLPPLLAEADVAVWEAVAAFGGAEGRVAEAMLALWRGIGEGPEAALSSAGELVGLLGEVVDAGANQIEAAKIEFYIELLILLIELLLLVATAVLTFGGSMAAAGPAVMVTRFAIGQVLKKAARELAENVVKKGVKDKVQQMVKGRVEQTLRSRLAGLAIRTGKDGIEEGAQEAATSAGTQAYQIGEGNRRGFDTADVATSLGLGALGGAVAGVASVGGLKTSSLTGNLGETVLRGAGGEVLAEVAVSVVARQSLSIADVGMAASSGAVGMTVGHTQHHLDARVGELHASAAAGSTGHGSGFAGSVGLSAPDAGLGRFAADTGDAAEIPATGDAVSVDVHLAEPQRVSDSVDTTSAVHGSNASAMAETGSVSPPPHRLEPTTAGGDLPGALASVGLPPGSPDVAVSAGQVSAGVPASLSAAMPATPAVMSPDVTPSASTAAVSSGVAAASAAASGPPGSSGPSTPAAIVGPGAAAVSSDRVRASGPPAVAPASPPISPPNAFGSPASRTTVPTPTMPPHGMAPSGPQPDLGTGPADPAGLPGDGEVPSVPPVPPSTGQLRQGASGAEPRSASRPAPVSVVDDAERLAYADEVLVGVRQRIHAELDRFVDELIAEARRRQDELLALMDVAHDEIRRRDLDDLYTAEMRRMERLRTEGRLALSEADLARVADRVFAIGCEAVMGGRFRTVQGGLDDASPVSQATGRRVPPPVEATRRYGVRGGYTPPLALHQRDLEQVMPRDDRGRPVRFPDVFGSWPALVNDGGPGADPARAINCVDVVLSVVDTWMHGRPRVAAPRTFDKVSLDDQFRPLGGEPGGAVRIERATGGVFQTVYPGRAGIARLEDVLRTAGHGACAVLIQELAHGQVHAVTVHNQHGQIVYVDAQASEHPVLRHPLPGAVRMDALVLDPDARPVDLGTPPGAWSARSAGSARASERMLTEVSVAQRHAWGVGAATLTDLGYESLSQVPADQWDQLAEALPHTAMLDPERLLFTECSVAPMLDDGPTDRGRPVTLVVAETELRLHGWRGLPIHAVGWGDGSIAAIDNQRLRAARRARLDRVPVVVHQPTDPLDDWPHTFGRRDTLPRLSVDIRRLSDGTLTIEGDSGEVVYRRGQLPATWGELAMFQAADQRILLHIDLFGADAEPVLLPQAPERKAPPPVSGDLRDTLLRLREGTDAAADAVQRDLEALGYALHGVEHRIRTQDSLERKFIDEGDRFGCDRERITSELANDVLRFSVVLPDGEGYVAALDAALDAIRQRGYEVVEEKNFWRPGNRFYGFIATLRSPHGRLFEVQFPTPTSLRAGRLTRELYETLRRKDDLPARRVHAVMKILAVNRRLRLPEMTPAGLSARSAPSAGGLAKWITENESTWRDYQAWLDYHGMSFAEIAAALGVTGDDFPITRRLKESDDAVLRSLQPRLRLGEGRAAGGDHYRDQSLWRDHGKLRVSRDALESLGESLEVRPGGQRPGSHERHVYGSDQADLTGGSRGDHADDHGRGVAAQRGDHHADLPVEGPATEAPRLLTASAPATAPEPRRTEARFADPPRSGSSADRLVVVAEANEMPQGDAVTAATASVPRPFIATTSTDAAGPAIEQEMTGAVRRASPLGPQAQSRAVGEAERGHGEPRDVPADGAEVSWEDVAHLLPVDDGGHRVTKEQCEFLGITPQQILAWAGRQSPLGLNRQQYDSLRDGLAATLAASGIDPAAVDTRMLGSSARFFSGPHKPFPGPQEVEADNPAQLHRYQQWPGEHPQRRPFDAMYQLGLDPEPSDYDLHLSSDAMVARADQIRRLFFPSDALYNQKYKFVHKPSVELAFPDLYHWARAESLKLGRSVNPALFSSAGPPDLSGPDGTGISSHFRDDDWMVHLPDHHQPSPATDQTTGRIWTVPFQQTGMTPSRLDVLRESLGLSPCGRFADDWDMKLGEGHLTVDDRQVRMQLWRTVNRDRWQVLLHAADNTLTEADIAPVLDRIHHALAASADDPRAGLATPPPDPEGRADG